MVARTLRNYILSLRSAKEAVQGPPQHHGNDEISEGVKAELVLTWVH